MSKMQSLLSYIKSKFTKKLIIKELSLATKAHDAYSVISQIECEITDLFEKHELDVYEFLEFEIGTDWYDNSIEIYFDCSLPYPYEPCFEIRKAIYNMGFSIVFWNFRKDTQDVICDRLINQPNKLMNSIDEIRGYEPRHFKNGKWISTKYGYVDERFNEKEWVEKYNFLNK